MGIGGTLAGASGADEVRWRSCTATATFDGGTTNALGDHDGTGDGAAIFTVTGNVIVRIIAVCTTNLTHVADATIEVGIEADPDVIIATTDLTVEEMTAKEIWHDATPDVEIEALSVRKEYIITDGNDILITVGVANVTAGVITFYCDWMPLSSDGLVTANDAA